MKVHYKEIHSTSKQLEHGVNTFSMHMELEDNIFMTIIIYFKHLMLVMWPLHMDRNDFVVIFVVG